MSAEDTYMIAISGTAAPGQELDEFQDAFCSLFRVTPEQFKGYFSGKPRIIREGLSATSAGIYLKALKNIGLESKLLRQDSPESAIEDAEIPAETPATAETAEEPAAEMGEKALTSASGIAHPLALAAVAVVLLAGGTIWQLVA